MKNTKGFGLVELLIVLVMLSFIAIIVISNIIRLQNESRYDKEYLGNWTVLSSNCSEVEIDYSKTKCHPDGITDIYLLVHGEIPLGGNCTIYLVNESE